MNTDSTAYSINLVSFRSTGPKTKKKALLSRHQGELFAILLHRKGTDAATLKSIGLPVGHLRVSQRICLFNER